MLAFGTVWRSGNWEPGDLDWRAISDQSLLIKCSGPQL